MPDTQRRKGDGDLIYLKINQRISFNLTHLVLFTRGFWEERLLLLLLLCNDTVFGFMMFPCPQCRGLNEIESSINLDQEFCGPFL